LKDHLRATITVRLTPRSSRDQIVGWREESLLVRVKAPPVDGRANDALLKLIAEALELPSTALTLVSGHTARNKRVRIEGITGEEARKRLGESRDSG
jgi:uncharacterized protein (TIGR00251 family)